MDIRVGASLGFIVLILLVVWLWKRNKGPFQ